MANYGSNLNYGGPSFDYAATNYKDSYGFYLNYPAYIPGYIPGSTYIPDSIYMPAVVSGIMPGAGAAGVAFAINFGGNAADDGGILIVVLLTILPTA